MDMLLPTSVCSFVVVVTVSSVEHTALIDGHHILDVDEGVFAPVCLKQFEGLLDQVAEVKGLPLCIINLVSKVLVLRFVQVEYWEDLPVVGYEGLTDSVRAEH